MSSRQTPAQSGANTPRFATLPRSARPTPPDSTYNEIGHSSSRPIPISQPAQPSSYFDPDLPSSLSQSQHLRDEQRNEGGQRFRDIVARSLGNDTMESRFPREQQQRRQLEHQWTLFGQLLEDNGAFRQRSSRRASAATGTPIRPRAVSAVRQAPQTPGMLEPPRREPLPAENGSLRRSSSRHTILDLTSSSSSQPNILSEEPPVDQELLDRSDNEEDSLISGTASLTAGSQPSDNQAEPPSHAHEQTDYSVDDSDNDDDSSTPPPSRASRTFSWLRIPALSPLQQKVLKCSLAYTIGCLFTFVPALSALLSDIVPLETQQGPSPTGHMVATVGKLYVWHARTSCAFTLLRSCVL